MNEELKVIITAEIDKLKQGMKKGKEEVQDFGKRSKEAIKKFNEGMQQAGDVSKKALATVGVAITGTVTALLALSESTEEYRTAQAKLNAAFETAGADAGVAKETYNDLYRVLGDTDVAVEAANHLAKLTTEQDKLAEYTNICQGVYATFGDSLAIEGLTEAINHTANLGEVQGTLADALEWSGISVDAFNEQLANCSTEAEREKLIRETLNGLYSEASSNYETSAADLLAQNEAQEKLNESMAKLGEAMQPINTMLAELGAEVLAELTPYIEEFAAEYLPKIQEALSGVGKKIGEVISWIADNWETITLIGGIILGIATAISVVSTVMGILNTVMSLSPITWIVLGIAALVAGFVLLWNKCDAFREFWQNLWAGIKDVFANLIEQLKPLWEAIVGAFKEAWELIKVVWDLVKPYFEAIWNNIKAVFSVVKDVLGGFFKAAWNNIKIVWDIVVSYFTTVWNNIKLIFSVVKDVLTGNFKGAWEGIKKIFSNWGSFFSGLWDKIKQIFSNVGQAIGNAISSTVKGAINAVLKTAVGIINGFISAINIAISVINAIPGVDIKKLSKLEVPQLAKGGIVDSATLAVVGEQGKEAIVPLENNTEWIDKIANKLSVSMGSGTPVILKVGEKTFGEICVDTINGITRQRGNLPLVLV